MSAVISRTVFERLPHLEDEVAYLYQARVFAGGSIVIDSPEPRRAFWQPFVVDSEGTRFSKYTPGWSAQLAAGTLMGQEWIINAFFSALTVAVVYRLGREVYNSDTGVIAAALTAFSPMALLLSGTLMGHTSALFWTTLFLYAYWRIERRHHAIRWGLIAGLALGILVSARPLTALAVAIPLIVWSGVRIVRATARTSNEYRVMSDERSAEEISAEYPVLSAEGKQQVEAVAFDHNNPVPFDSVLSTQHSVLQTLAPLAVLSLVTLILSLSVPLYNEAAVGDPFENLYTYVWSYDRVGFGEGYGRNTHTLEKGFRHARFDLSLTAADLFGWQTGTMVDANGDILPDIQNQLLVEGDYWLRTGLSWVLIPLGLIVAYKRRSWLVALWFAALYGWIRFAYDFQGGAQLTNPHFAWLWIAVAFAWLLLPFLVLRRRVEVWTWILVSVTLSVVGFQLAYWIGSQRYSTRYYFEALTAVALISALPIAWLARQRISGFRWLRPAVYAVFAIALLYSFYAYSVPRIDVLRGFNFISRQMILDVEKRREGDQPVLVIVNGNDVRWRAFGTLMAVTSPYLDSEIVVAWNYQNNDSLRQQLIDRFPDRQVIDMEAQENRAWFTDTMGG